MLICDRHNLTKMWMRSLLGNDLIYAWNFPSKLPYQLDVKTRSQVASFAYIWTLTHMHLFPYFGRKLTSACHSEYVLSHSYYDARLWYKHIEKKLNITNRAKSVSPQECSYRREFWSPRCCDRNYAIAQVSWKRQSSIKYLHIYCVFHQNA